MLCELLDGKGGGRGRGAVRTLNDLTLCLKWPVIVSGRKCFSFWS